MKQKKKERKHNRFFPLKMLSKKCINFMLVYNKLK